MGEVKQRDYVFDALRGLCMWSIPISHFTRMAGHFSQASLSGVVYITINVFVMQAFIFLSGYFSFSFSTACDSCSGAMRICILTGRLLLCGSW